MKTSKAFTLIELLVVIAIIAILAAILFPVFAQAKVAAKKTSDISNMKQMTTAIKIYMNDSDDLWPITIHFIPSSSSYQEAFFTTPWDRVTSTPEGLDRRKSFWGNAIQPYVKNWQLYRNATSDWNMFNIDNPVANPMNFADAYSLNEYLNGYSDSAIASQSSTIAFWQAMGTGSIQGYTYAYPPMVLSGTYLLPFHYNRTGTPGVTCPQYLWVYSGQHDARIWNEGHNLSYTDSSTKYVRTPSGKSPWAGLNADGTPASGWILDPGTTNNCIWYYFQAPDETR